MGDVTDLEEGRRLRRERARIGDFSEPDDTVGIVVPVERTADGERRIAIMAPDCPNAGWSLTPSQAEEIAAYLVEEAKEARWSK